MVTGYRLEVQGLNPGRARYFFLLQNVWNPPNLLSVGQQGIYWVVRQPGCEINHSCQSGAEINSEGLQSTPSIYLHDVDMGTILPGCQHANDCYHGGESCQMIPDGFLCCGWLPSGQCHDDLYIFIQHIEPAHPNSLVKLQAPGFKYPRAVPPCRDFQSGGFNFQRLLLEKKSYLVDFSSKCNEIKFRSVYEFIGLVKNVHLFL